MMENLLTTTNITFILALLGVLFGIYHYFKNPQIKSDKTEALLEQSIKTISEKFDDKFKTLETQILRLETNHIHTLETKIDANKHMVNLLAIQVGKLETKIDERIPRLK